MTAPWLVLVESNTTGTGRDFAEAARAQGLRPVLMSRAPHRYPYAAELGLDVVTVDTGGAGVVEAACRALAGPVAGVTSSSDYFVQTAASVAGALGLPAPDPGAIGRCRDKGVQRRWLRARGVPVPDFAECRTAADTVAAAAMMAAPVVVKPVSGSGSQGVRACGDPDSAGRWARHLLRTGTRILVEREVDGPEFSVEIVDGAAVGLTRKHVGDAPYFVETGHDYPAPVPRTLADALCSTAVEAVRAVGLDTGPAHVELRQTAGRGPVIIEINPRLAGGLIPRLVRYASGRDLVAEVVARAAGQPAEPVGPGAGFASIRFVVPDKAGLVAEVTGLDRARRVPGIVEVACTAQPGTWTALEHSFVDRRGHVIGVGATSAAVVSAVERAIGEIRITFAPEGPLGGPGKDDRDSYRVTQ